LVKATAKADHEKFCAWNRALEKKFAFGNTGDDVFRPHCPDVVADDVGDHALSEPFPRVGQKFPKRTQGALAFHWCSTFEFFVLQAEDRPSRIMYEMPATPCFPSTHSLRSRGFGVLKQNS
jgi:hypothetical protein